MLKIFAIFLLSTLAASETLAQTAGRGGRIVNGTAATDTQFPFVNQVTQYAKTGGSYSSCTGTFLSTSWVITALHCIAIPENVANNTFQVTMLANLGPLRVWYGSAIKSSPLRKVAVVDYVVYWKEPNARIDLALLHLETPVVLNEYVGVAQLPPLSTKDSFYEGYSAVQAGYGAGRDLQYHSLFFNNKAPGCPSFDGFEKYTMCGQSSNNVSRAETGDSGSSVFIYEDGVPTLIGIFWGLSSMHHVTRLSLFIELVSRVTGIPLRP